MRGMDRNRAMWEMNYQPEVEDYRIVSSSDPQEVENEVKDKLNQGWALLGELTYSKRHEIYTQAMYKPTTGLS